MCEKQTEICCSYLKMLASTLPGIHERNSDDSFMNESFFVFFAMNQLIESVNPFHKTDLNDSFID